MVSFSSLRNRQRMSTSTIYANTNGAIAAKWPIESQKPGGLSDGGSHIGLLQTMTDPNQTPDPNAWNWITNASDGVNLFSGTPPTEYQDTENKTARCRPRERNDPG